LSMLSLLDCRGVIVAFFSRRGEAAAPFPSIIFFSRITLIALVDPVYLLK
jgi:hypothetical protein